MKRGVFLIFLLIIFASSVSALGISPASKDFDFLPGKEIVVHYTILSDDPEMKIELTLDGDLKEFATLSKNFTQGTEGVVLTINLPNQIDGPGLHAVSLTASEPQPTGGATIGTRISISSEIRVRVPYPGKYIEAKLDILDGDVDEEIPIELNLINRGSEETAVQSRIDFYSLGKLVRTMPFSVVLIKSADRYVVKDVLNTNGFEPGDYFAEAIIDYGEKTKVNDSFRVGSLFVNITNFTTKLPRGGIQRFYVDIESRWNKELKGVFADINISNSSSSIMIRTPPVDLEKWQKERLEGYLDTSAMKGNYDSEIFVKYADEQTITRGKLAVGVVKLKINPQLLVGIIASLIIIAVAIIFYRRKNLSKRKT